MNAINFEWYKVFYYVAANLSFSAAASQLFISQSAVSQSIKLLEERLGSKLFFRNTKQVKLTPAGELLFRHVEQAFIFLQTGERSIGELHSLQQGEIKIAASDTICKYFLLPYIKNFHRLYPAIKIHITNRPSPVCAKLLEKGLVDVAVLNLPHGDTGKNMNLQKLTPIQDIFIAGPAFAELANDTLAINRLQEVPLLLLESNSTTRTFFDYCLLQKGVTILPEIELGSVEILIELVKIGLGISFLAREYVQKELADNELISLTVDVDIPPRYLGVVTHNCLPVSFAAQKFIDILVQTT